jgi:putative FmdB family regulatory protein
MPIYEYVCTECEHAHEALQKLSDAPLTLCLACDKSALRKKISAPGFRLSGSGWYETDFKSEKQRNLVDKPKDTSEKSGNSGASSDKKSVASKKEAAA